MKLYKQTFRCLSALFRTSLSCRRGRRKKERQDFQGAQKGGAAEQGFIKNKGKANRNSLSCPFGLAVLFVPPPFIEERELGSGGELACRLRDWWTCLTGGYDNRPVQFTPAGSICLHPASHWDALTPCFKERRLSCFWLDCTPGNDICCFPGLPQRRGRLSFTTLISFCSDPARCPALPKLREERI